MVKIYEEVIKFIKNDLPDLFGLIIDGWKGYFH
jgi:hypothetical protein